MHPSLQDIVIDIRAEQLREAERARLASQPCWRPRTTDRRAPTARRRRVALPIGADASALAR